MKLLQNIALFALLLLIMTGCFSEDYSICPPIEEANVTLHFSLGDKNERENFVDNISNVDVLVYDEQGAFQDSLHVGPEELKEFQGTHLVLPAGEYRLVCWGNSGDNVEMTGVRTELNPIITYANIEGNTVGNTDRVYYADKIDRITTRATNIPDALQLVVPEEGKVEAQAQFHSAHRILNIYVIGYTENLKPALPDIEIRGLTRGLYLFSKANLDEQKVNSYQKSRNRVIEGEKYACSSFNTFWFEIAQTKEIIINIYNPTTDELILTVPLSEAIDDSLGDEDIGINLLFRFTAGEVEIETPNWGSSDVGWDEE